MLQTLRLAAVLFHVLAQGKDCVATWIRASLMAVPAHQACPNVRPLLDVLPDRPTPPPIAGLS
jgi:hypothetical protein